MASRLDLHEELCKLLGSRNVYFQPPESVKMNYPAIVYFRDKIDNTFANNEVYLTKRGYTVTVIDKDPDSELVEKMIKFPTSKWNRHYTSNNLNHDVFSIYY